MVFPSLPTLPLPSFRHDALLGALGFAVRGCPLPRPLDAEPWPRRMTPQAIPDRQHAVRPHLWRHLAAGATTAPAITRRAGAREG